MRSLVHEDQVGLIHTRSSADNIRCFINIMWAISSLVWSLVHQWLLFFLTLKKGLIGWNEDIHLGLYRYLDLGRILLSVNACYNRPEAAVETNQYKSLT